MKCPAAHYFDWDEMDCIPCTDNCMACKSRQKCTMCEDGYELVKQDGKIICI